MEDDYERRWRAFGWYFTAYLSRRPSEGLDLRVEVIRLYAVLRLEALGWRVALVGHRRWTEGR